MSKKSVKKVVQYDKIIKAIKFILVKYDLNKFSKNHKIYFGTVTKKRLSISQYLIIWILLVGVCNG
ncbi:hypothetical protein BJP37_01660 [Moorena bouillonii PNG]|uniref:Uncharacterized protein n=1 Tax=Moorena bouillonii PNG TaxID=568701 RepID=A0A1U7MW38_9CYAN|nr:hypothetical protein BJP37_01660 [Moorena bouillonii PNG]